MSINERTGGHHETWIDNPNRPCATKDPELWFAPAADRYAKNVKRMADDWAKVLCGGCPVTTQCLQLALSVDPIDDLSGVYGGTTADDRAAIRADRALRGGVDAA